MKPIEEYPVLNEKLLSCVLKFLEEHPDNYNQNDWLKVDREATQENICGTIGCVAGWTCVLTFPKERDWTAWAYGMDPKLNRDYSRIAAKELGLTHEEAGFLFRGTNRHLDPQSQLVEIKRRVGVIHEAREKGVPPLAISTPQ